MKHLTYKYSYIWLIASRWQGFHRSLKKDFPLLNNGFSVAYKQRLIRSAVRGASLMYILSKSANKTFDQQVALTTGMLSALFDDLIDIGAEEFGTIEMMITKPETATVVSHLGETARNLYISLLEKMQGWQKQQLTGVLMNLLEIEKAVKIKRNGEWQQRGTCAFFVYLTLVCIPLEDVNREVACKYGEYLQLLDDYEDFHADDPPDNFFRSYPGFDLTRYYLNEIKPKLPLIFNFEFNHAFFCEFVEVK